MPTPSLVNIPFITAPNVLFSQIPESGAGDFTVTRATTPDAGRSTRVNAAGLIELVPDNVARLDYPVGGGCPALLVEPAATNGIRNNSMVGAVAGSPGLLPTNWSNAGSGLTRQSIVTGTLNGIPYIDIRISGTANNTFHDVFWDANNIIAASVGQNWVASCYLQIIAQPNPPVNYVLAMREFNSGGGFLGVFQGPALSISTTSFDRFSFTRALNQITVAFVHPSLFFSLVNGQTYDFTIRIGYPQMELGSVATSVIPTTTAAVTRSAEQIRRANVSSLIGQTEGTIYLEVEAPTATNDVVAIQRQTLGTSLASGDYIMLQKTPTNLYRFVVAVGGSLSFTITQSAPPTTSFVKIAMAYRGTSSASSAFFINGTQVGSDNTTTFSFPPSIQNIEFVGNQLVGAQTIRIRAFTLYPTRLSNVDLVNITAPAGSFWWGINMPTKLWGTATNEIWG